MAPVAPRLPKPLDAVVMQKAGLTAYGRIRVLNTLLLSSHQRHAYTQIMMSSMTSQCASSWCLLVSGQSESA